MTNLFTDLKAFVEKYEDTAFYSDMNLYAEYVDYGHSGICGMTFEGIVYDAINYDQSSDVFTELEAICTKHNVWYENGDAWNCSFYKN